MTDDVQEILRRAEHPRSPTPAELARMRERVFGPGEINEVRGEWEEPQSDADVTILQTDLLPSDRTTRIRPRRLVPLAAAILLIAGLIVTYAVQDEPDTVVTAPPVPEVCANQVPRLVDALEQWRSIETWAMVGASEPDLGERLALVLDALNTTAAAAIADDLRMVLDESSDSPGQHVEVRLASARLGFEEVVAELSPFGDDCQVADLRTVLG